MLIGRMEKLETTTASALKQVKAGRTEIERASQVCEFDEVGFRITVPRFNIDIAKILASSFLSGAGSLSILFSDWM